MKPVLPIVYLVMTIVLSSFTSTAFSRDNSTQEKITGSTERGKVTPIDSKTRNAYRNFSVELLQAFFNSSDRPMGEPVGGKGLSPLNLGYLLAVLQNQIWPIPSDGFASALHLDDQDIQESYQSIIANLNKDPQFFLHSHVHTSIKGVKTSENLNKLRTRVSYINYNAPSTNLAVFQMNAMIIAQTYGKLSERFVPLGGWYGSAVYNYTLGVFINTFYFNGEWKYPFYSIGSRTFGGVSALPFLEASGKFLVTQEPNYLALRIPLKQGTKVLTVVQPLNGLSVEDFISKNLSEFLQAQEMLRRSDTPELEIKVQLPAFNFTLINSFSQILARAGLNNTLCQYAKKEGNTFDAFAQSFYGHLGEDKFEIASATGTILNSVSAFREAYSLNKGTEEERPSNQSHVKRNAPKISKSSPTVEIITKSETNKNVDKSVFTLDSPFLWFFEHEDLGLGPLVYGTMDSPPLPKEPDNFPDGFEWLGELATHFYWSCPDHLQ